MRVAARGVTQTGLSLPEPAGGLALLPAPRPTMANCDRLLTGCKLKPQSSADFGTSLAPTVANGLVLYRRVPVLAGTTNTADVRGATVPRLPEVVCVSKLTVMG